MSVWLNIDKPTRKVTLHVAVCRYVRKRDESEYKPTAPSIYKLHRDGGWVEFPFTADAEKGFAAYGEITEAELEFRRCSTCDRQRR